MVEVRCKNCNKLLGYIESGYEIQCPRCKTMNTKKESVNEQFVNQRNAKECVCREN